MKTTILKIFTVAAVSASMVFNLKVYHPEVNSDTFIRAVQNQAIAQSESSCPGGYCIVDCGSTAMSCCIEAGGYCDAGYQYMDCNGWILSC